MLILPTLGKDSNVDHLSISFLYHYISDLLYHFLIHFSINIFFFLIFCMSLSTYLYFSYIIFSFKYVSSCHLYVRNYFINGGNVCMFKSLFCQ